MSQYGYIGKDGPTQAVLSNSGVFSVNEHKDLLDQDKILTLGQLELIQTQTIDDSDFSETILYMDFTSLGDYNIHFLTYSNMFTQGYGYPTIRFSNDGGSSFEASGYQYAYWNTAEDTVNEGKNTSDDGIKLSANQYQNCNGYVYLFNLKNSAKYSFTTNQSSNVGGNNVSKDVAFGGGLYSTAEAHNGIRLRMNNANYIGTLTASLYGIKEY